MSVAVCIATHSAAKPIAGAIRRTDLHMRINIVPLGALALLGTPLSFVQFDGELDVEIRRADSGAIVWRHGFEIDERRNVGLYYGYKAAYEMFSALLRAREQRAIRAGGRTDLLRGDQVAHHLVGQHLGLMRRRV